MSQQLLPASQAPWGGSVGLKRWGRATGAWARPLVLPLLLLGVWEWLSRLGDSWAFAFPPLQELGATALSLLVSGDLGYNLLASARTAATGLVVGSAAGLVLGAGMGASDTVNRLLGPLYHAMRQVPLLGWIPLIGLWFGHGLLSKTLIVCLAAFYPMVLNTSEGIRNADRRYLEAGRIMGLSRWQQLRFILLPDAMPSVFTGLMHALAFSWISTVGAELLFTAGPGLGGLMQIAQAGSRMDVVVLCVVSIGVVGFAANFALARLRNHVLRWRPVR